MRVAAVDPGNKVVLKPVRLGRDLGNRVEIQSGLSLTDRLIDNPQESIEAGAIVRIADVKRPTVAAAE
jgi:membrane fusion protein (multidrug efflux system)